MPVALRDSNHSMLMPFPFLIRVFQDPDPTSKRGSVQVQEFQEEGPARAYLVRQLQSLPHNSTVELWKYHADNLYELLEGHDKLFEPKIYSYDASMLSEDPDRVRWDGRAETYLYQSEDF